MPKLCSTPALQHQLTTALQARCSTGPSLTRLGTAASRSPSSWARGRCAAAAVMVHDWHWPDTEQLWPTQVIKGWDEGRLPVAAAASH